ncbi:MAG TPA: T9SS type A sorting domain-containing protein, partial [bacterium]
FNRQFYPTAAWDGNQFTTAWVDYRSLTGVVDQLRGDIYAARVSFAGTVLDPNGIQLTSGPLPEDLPAAAAANGKTLFAFSKLYGLAGNPEIERLGYRILESMAGGGVEITMAPVNPPIQIPASGGSFSFDISIQNISTSQQTFDFWIMQRLPINTWQGPMLGPIALNMSPGATITRQRTQNVPGRAIPGIYAYIGYVGAYSAVKWDSSFFTYTKLASSDGPAVSDWSGSGEDFSSDETIITPHSSLLASVMPNPFNPSATITFALPQAERVILSVYDLSGRRVAELVNGRQEAGQHRVNFDGSNLASGIYLYRLSAGNYAATGKMVLMK